MGSGTRIMGNRASRGRAYYLAYGSEADMIYALPAPLAHWVPYPFQCVRYQAPCPRSNPSCSAPDLPDDQQPWNRTRYPETRSQYVTTMTKGPLDDDFPFPCAPGKWSDSTTVSSQSRSSCSGPCPSGFFCGAATHTPSPCPRGAYCPRGSAVGMLCEAGTFQDAAQQTSCKTCPAGSACTAGAVGPGRALAGARAARVAVAGTVVARRTT